MSGKYREGLKAAGKVGPLDRKINKVAREVREVAAKFEADVKSLRKFIEARQAEQAAAADLRAADPMLTFVTRAELVEVLESGELPEGWITPSGDEETPGDVGAEQ